jgi:hypothetical protein
MKRRAVGLAAVLDDRGLCRKLVPPDRSLRLGASPVDGIVFALGRSFEARIFLDRQRSMENIAFDDSGTVELDPARVDRTLDLTPDGQLFRDHIALHPGALIDHDIRRLHLALNVAEYVSVPSPEILPTTVMPRLMVDTGSVDVCRAGLFVAGGCGVCAAEGS